MQVCHWILFVLRVVSFVKPEKSYTRMLFTDFSLSSHTLLKVFWNRLIGVMHYGMCIVFIQVLGVGFLFNVRELEPSLIL